MKGKVGPRPPEGGGAAADAEDDIKTPKSPISQHDTCNVALLSSKKLSEGDSVAELHMLVGLFRIKSYNMSRDVKFV